MVQLTVNNKEVNVDCPARTLLVELLREHLELTGTHQGCDTTQCGACTVHLNGRAVKSCTVLAAQCQGAEVTTIEGVAATDALQPSHLLHPMQDAFRQCHGLQCGFCTPGMIMASIDLVNREDALDERVIREGLKGNICRCTGYHNIVKAVELAAESMRNQP